MELVNEFRVPVSIDRAWEVLTDIERIAPCMPGAQLLSVQDEVYTLAVKVKVGPITASYQGTAVFEEKDADAHRAVIKADGRETRGQGNAGAVIVAALTEEGGSTAVRLATDLTISGKAAQFGRGVLADVSGKLIKQFARNLEADLAGDAARSESEPVPVLGSPEVSAASAVASAPPAGVAPPPLSEPPATRSGGSDSQPAGRHRGDSDAVAARPREAEAVDVLGTAALPVAKRVVPVLAGLVAVLLLVRRARRKG